MDTHLQCQICKKTFTQKSSLIRHSKRCTPGPAPSLRQKSCKQCTMSKTKCSLRRPRCERCEARDTRCDYVIPMTRGTQTVSLSEENGFGIIDESLQEHVNLLGDTDLVPISFEGVSHPLLSTDMDLDMTSQLASFGLLHPPMSDSGANFNLLVDKDPFTDFQSSFPMSTEEALSASLFGPTTQLALETPSFPSTGTSPESNGISPDDWLLWAPGNPDSAPPLVRHSMQTLLRVIKTWPRMLAKGFQTPPMFHFLHIHPDSVLQPMVNCITITKMWMNQSDGATEIVRQTVIQEMRQLFERYRSMDERHLLSTLQALVMYTIILLFPGRHQNAVSLVDPAIFLCLQKLVSYVAKTGLMLTEERDNTRPSWESWTHVTGKRRAVFSLYLLHWSYSVYHGLRSFACSQLGFMPAPAPKFLWQATNRCEWEELYSAWLRQWGDSPYMMREFAAIQCSTSLERRSEMWLEDADELGVLFFTIGTTVHPCVEWW